MIASAVLASDVTVLGAGIAGLAIAIACAQRGRSVTVIEQAAALTDIGAG
ncbi:MAG: FAD-dependent oxidoreductase, partial [Jannaschia helgolandensis]